MSLLQLLKEKNIIKYGDFKLKSGETSNIYINLKKVISYPNLHTMICNEISEIINPNIELICGAPYGAISYVSIISVNKNIPMILLRKEQKNYGLKNLIEGEFTKNQKVVLIEDVITTGSSIFESAKNLEDNGLVVSQIISIFSRSDNLNLQYNNIPIQYLYHSNELNN